MLESRLRALNNLRLQCHLFLSVIIFSDGEGKIPSRLSLLGPDKNPLFPEQEIVNGIEILKGRPAIFLSGLKPFAGPKFGTYTIVLKMGKTAFKFPFLVEKAPTPKKK